MRADPLTAFRIGGGEQEKEPLMAWLQFEERYQTIAKSLGRRTIDS